jgi:Prokaryotic Cytochrome C oxidase subunit IV
MTNGWSPQPSTVRLLLLLMALSLLSTLLVERFDHAAYAVGAIFVIAAVKSDLVIMHYMEAGRAEPHWKFLYRGWLVIVTVLLIGGHVIAVK